MQFLKDWAVPKKIYDLEIVDLPGRQSGNCLNQASEDFRMDEGKSTDI
jgi:hypothetical protein